jgi:hypothetical protein
MRCNDMFPFSSCVGERKIMNHFSGAARLLLCRAAPFDMQHPEHVNREIKRL